MTAKERRRAYKKALTFMKKTYDYHPLNWVLRGKTVYTYEPQTYRFSCACICGAMSGIRDLPFKLKEFPELLECKPLNKATDEFWWPESEHGFMMRILALEYCIQRTYQWEDLEKSIAKLER